MANQLFKDKRLYAIFGITLIAVMGVASIAPALPSIARTLDLTKTQIGWMISAFTFPGIILTPIAGIIADRIGRKKVLIPSLFIFSLAGFAIFFIHNFHYIIILRILQGIGAAALGSLNTTLVGDFFKGKQMPQVMGYNASVLSLSTAAYPLIGGILSSIVWYYPFALPLLAIPVGLYVIFAIKEPEIQRHASLKQYLVDISGSIFKKEVVGLFILGTITFIILYGTFLTYMPILLDSRFSLSSAQIGIFISISSITTAIVATQVGKLTWKYGSIALLKMAFLLYLIVSLIIPNVTSLYIFVIPILFFGAAQALNIPSLQTTLAKLAPDNKRGAFMSLNGMVIRIGQTLGPLIIGIGYTINGISGAYYLGAIFAFLGIITTFTMLKEKNN